MEYKNENRICQNCKGEFVIEPEDFKFYEKIKVPPPTFCPECRLIRRLSWRNERTLYHDSCDLCKKKMFSMYPEKRSYPVFCHDCWISDKWDPIKYGEEYNFNVPFFEQFNKFIEKVPRMNLFNVNSKNVEYTNLTRESKNICLAYSIVGPSEEVYYSKDIDRSKRIFDSLIISDCENCTWVIYCGLSYNMLYSHNIRNCFDSSFLFDCRNCSHCFMSANLRNQQYIFRGKRYQKEKYEELIKQIDTGSYKVFQELVLEFEEMKERAIHRFADMGKVVNSTGDALGNAKNAKNCFNSYDIENIKWVARTFALKDSYDVNYGGLNSELIYEFITGGTISHNVLFNVASVFPINDSIYNIWCGGRNLFGCFGVKEKQYCILNKQYTKEEYEKLVPKIIEHMNKMPYRGKNGRTYTYGEFFPFELSLYGYNETLAQEMYPLSEAEIKEKEYKYKEKEIKQPTVSLFSKNLPDHIIEIKDEILKETINCEHEAKCLHQCTGAFRIHPEELSFYRKFNLPLPRTCPNCRHYKRLEYRKPWRLWHRKCMKEGCSNEFETSYAPDRPEIVYCEKCYNQEVY